MLRSAVPRLARAALPLRPLPASWRSAQIQPSGRFLRRSFASTGNKAAANTASRAQMLVKNFRDMTWEQKKELGKRVLGWSAFAFGGLVVFRVFTDTTSFLVNLTNYQVFMAGVTTGAISASAVIGGGYMLRKSLQIRPEPLYRHVLKFLKRDARVVEALGKKLDPGKFRAYRYEGTAMMPNRKLQMMFELHGEKHAATVSVEVARKMGKFDFELLAVDVKGTGDRIILSGDVARELGG